MFLIRQSKPEDVGTLLKLARMVYFINLPPDEKLIAEKIAFSRDCLRQAAGVAPAELSAGEGTGAASGYASTQGDSDLFMFTMEDTETGGVIGTSQIRAHMGGPDNPNYAMRVMQREFKSKSLGVGTTHLVGRMFEDRSGPTEVGGLILQPSLRGHPRRPGKFLSLIRFHFMGLHRRLFADRVLAEMMAQVSSDGDNLFWDHIGRKFIPVKYAEADRFCQHNRRFIDELLPKDDLYLSLLPLEVLNTVGQTAKETVPARRLLENLGFKYKNFIDPFDGGPHLEAKTDDIAIVKSSRWGTFGGTMAPGKATHRGFVSTLRGDGQFRAVDTEMSVDAGGSVRVPQDAAALLNAEAGGAVGFTPVEKVGTTERASGRGSRGRKASKPSRRTGTKKVKA